jgi:hypothetical protein
MDKQLFDDAIGEVPPSTVDVDAVIVRGRRAARVRRVANPAVAAGVAVVLLTGAIAFTVYLGDGDGDGVRVGQTATSTTSPMPTTSLTGPLPEACTRTDLESADEVVARLTPLVRTKVQALRPDLQLTASPDEQLGPFGFLQEHDNTIGDVPICDRTSSFRAFASTEGPEGIGSISIVVRPADSDDPGSCDARLASCEKGTGPTGDRFRQKTTVEEGATYTQVDVIRPDGTHVYLSSGGPISSGAPLNHQQLIAIGTDPGMTLFP